MSIKQMRNRLSADKQMRNRLSADCSDPVEHRLDQAWQGYDMENRNIIESIQNTVRNIKCMNHRWFHSSEWQLPLLAQPGPANDAIHWALLSLLIS